MADAWHYAYTDFGEGRGRSPQPVLRAVVAVATPGSSTRFSAIIDTGGPITVVATEVLAVGGDPIERGDTMMLRLGGTTSEVSLFDLTLEVPDFSLESLERLWPVLVERYGALPSGGDVADMEDRPVWVEFQPAIAAEMGPARIRFAAIVGSYVAEVSLRSHPLVCWSIADVKSHADYRKTMLEFGPEGPRFDPEGAVGTMLEQATATDDPHALRPLRRQPDALRQLVELRVDALRKRLGSPNSPDDANEFAVSLVEHVGDRYAFTFRDEVDDAMSDRIDAVLVTLGEVEGIGAVDRTDRERFEVVAGELDASAVHAAVQAAFQ